MTILLITHHYDEEQSVRMYECTLYGRQPIILAEGDRELYAGHVGQLRSRGTTLYNT